MEFQEIKKKINFQNKTLNIRLYILNCKSLQSLICHIIMHKSRFTLWHASLFLFTFYIYTYFLEKLNKFKIGLFAIFFVVVLDFIVIICSRVASTNDKNYFIESINRTCSEVNNGESKKKKNHKITKPNQKCSASKVWAYLIIPAHT